MKQGFVSLVFVAACLAGVATAEPIQHVLVLGDESRGFIHYVDQLHTNNSFSVAVPRPVWDLRACGENRYRSIAGKGFTVVDFKQRAIVDRFAHDALGGLSSVCDLPDGGFIAGTTQKIEAKEAIVVYRFNAQRALQGRTVFAGVGCLRMMTRLDNGEVLLAYNDGILRVTLAAEGSEQGKVLQTYKQPRSRNAYKAIPARAGGIWSGTGYAGQLVRYTAAGQIAQTFEAQQPAQLKNHFYAEPVELPNGHLVVANWTGHGANDSAKGWQVIEFDTTGQVVWYLHDPARYGSISGVTVLK